MAPPAEKRELPEPKDTSEEENTTGNGTAEETPAAAEEVSTADEPSKRYLTKAVADYSRQL